MLLYFMLQSCTSYQLIKVNENSENNINYRIQHMVGQFLNWPTIKKQKNNLQDFNFFRKWLGAF